MKTQCCVTKRAGMRVPAVDGVSMYDPLYWLGSPLGIAVRVVVFYSSAGFGPGIGYSIIFSNSSRSINFGNVMHLAPGTSTSGM